MMIIICTKVHCSPSSRLFQTTCVLNCLNRPTHESVTDRQMDTHKTHRQMDRQIDNEEMIPKCQPAWADDCKTEKMV